ncbi:MAG: isoleucine--tRNA ligase [Candidatus Woesearchaeota archaeon]
MEKSYDFKSVEEEVMEFWKKSKTYQNAKKKLKGKKQFYFLDGPPYTSGRVHIGTAWNKSLKDTILRYKRMQGFDAWDRAGYDMHGMPTEQGVERELGIKFKEDIPKFGVDKFVKACKEFSIRNMNLMNKDFQRLGVWMDFENAYQPIDPKYIEGEWWLIAQAHKNKRLYEGEKTMHWCAKDGTALAKHELEYKLVTEDSIFIKFPVVGKNKEFLIIWTTTPWTIPFNLGVMVNPELEYVRAKVGDEVWIIAKRLVAAVVQSVADKQYKIIEEFTGDKLAGTKYMHPFYEEISEFKELEKKSDKLFTVVLSSEYVDLSAGSGLVHMAPGCGPEDYEVGYREGIPPFNNLTESGIFPKSMGRFAGLKAKKDDAQFIKALEEKGYLIATTKVEHDYAHCWRCKSPVIFRTTKQWFFKVEDMIPEMRELNKKIYWMPDYAGSRQFDSWLANLRDNGITRQRFWGTPLPVWRCEKCQKYVVIGSLKELQKHAGKIPEDLHKPWIDEVEWKCKCSGTMKRVPDILDVWIDAGSASWNCLGFPQKKALFKKLFPADFILEGIDQIRGWFNLLFVASMVSMHKPSFKAVYMHGFVQDSQGRKMSKSLGNYILPEEVVGKYGADTLRFYMIGGTNPGLDLNYNFEDMQIKSRNISVLWNLHNFLIDYVHTNGIKQLTGKPSLSIEEEYIISKSNNAVKKATEAMEAYRLNEVPWIVEGLFLELSRGYIQMVREKSSSGTEEEKMAVAYTIYRVLFDAMRLLSIICPFITEKMYQNIKHEFKLNEKSIHHEKWPGYIEKEIDQELEEQMETTQNIIQAVLRAREQAKLGVRWPLAEAIIITKDAKTKEASERTEEVLRKITNIKKIIVKENFEGTKASIKPEYKTIGPEFGAMAPSIIAKILSESPETVISHIEKDGRFMLKLDGKEVAVRKEHLIITRTVPEPYIEAEFKNGRIYINTRLNRELEAEGYAREITRRVQQLRKEAGLNKTDTITLEIVSDEAIKEMISGWQQHIKDRVGASKVEFSKTGQKHIAEKKEKIREHEIEIFISK